MVSEFYEIRELGRKMELLISLIAIDIDLALRENAKIIEGKKIG